MLQSGELVGGRARSTQHDSRAVVAPGEFGMEKVDATLMALPYGFL